MKILVAEDNPVNRELLRHVLVQLGHTVILAADGVTAVRTYHEVGVDLILMDLWMPGLDGLAATREIRKQETGTGRRVPIVAVTAHAIKGDKEACLDAGMDFYLTKPIRRENLVDTIAHLSSGNGQSNPSNSEPALSPWIGVDAEILPRLGKMMIESTQESLASLHDCVQKQDWKRMSRAAHTLRGSLGLFGAQKSAATVVRIERALTGGQHDGIPGLMTQLDQDLEAVLNEVSKRSAGTLEIKSETSTTTRADDPPR